MIVRNFCKSTHICMTLLLESRVSRTPWTFVVCVCSEIAVQYLHIHFPTGYQVSRNWTIYWSRHDVFELR